MATVLSQRIFSPTTLLYSFVVITQIGFGLHLGRQTEEPGAYTLLHWAAELWIFGWWLRSDSRKRGVALIYDMGFFLLIAWPIVMPYHLLKTRGAKGLLIILGFVGAYFGAAMLGIIISILATGLA